METRSNTSPPLSRQSGEERRLAGLIAVTGANGFIGRELVNHLVLEGFAVRALHRELEQLTVSGVEQCALGELNADTDFRRALADATVVVHLAARVEEVNEDDGEGYSSYETVNTQATFNLARTAAQLKVRRFIFLSTVKVNGEFTEEKPFSEGDEPRPSSPYALSKWKAEQGLHQIAQESGLEVVIVRSPLVFGPGVRGNFLRLMDLVERAPVLPLGALDNRRSLVGLGNLTDMLARCIVHQNAAGETFFVSDGRDLSVTELIRLIASCLSRRCVLLYVPKRILKILASLTGRQEAVNRLTGSLRVDIGKARRVLNWQPCRRIDTEMTRTVQWYKQMLLEKDGHHATGA